jgi:hypothetical protein
MATYAGEVRHRYGFCSVATDNVGYRQSAPSRAQANTTVAIYVYLPLISGTPAQEASPLGSAIRFEPVLLGLIIL